MSLETVAAGAARENERGQHCQRCENPLHLSLPSLGLHVLPGFFVCSSGSLVGDLRA